ncbi:MAG: hypothetical protein P9M07_01590 [Candidatus Aceula meridiana]|nr:hypothetical protein [Candidatus Aceula meridiana]
MLKIPEWYVKKFIEESGARVVFDRLVKFFRIEVKKSPELRSALDEALRLQRVFEEQEKLNPIQREKLKKLLVAGMRIDETLGD